MATDPPSCWSPAHHGCWILAIAGFASGWAGTAWLLASVTPPATERALWPAWVSWVVACTLLATAAWRDHRWWSRNADLLLTANALAMLLVGRCFWTGIGSLSKPLLTLVALASAGLGAALALVHLDGDRRRLAAGLAGPLIVVGVYITGWPSPMEALAFRLRAGRAPSLEREAGSLLAQEGAHSSTATPPLSAGAPFAVEADNQRFVAWPLENGIPFRTTGLVYAPDGLPPGPDGIRSGLAFIDRFHCQHSTGPWYWCRLY